MTGTPHAWTPARAKPRGPGFTLLELVTALATLAVLAALVLPTFDVLARLSLHRSADLAAGHLARSRLEALARREKLAVRLVGGGRLQLVDASGSRISEVDLAGQGLLAIDSARIRPRSIRYNPRGQGSPGSLYLYRGRRGVRVISNFVGRVRRQSFHF